MTVEDMIRILSEYPMEMRVFASKSLNPVRGDRLTRGAARPVRRSGRSVLFRSYRALKRIEIFARRVRVTLEDVGYFHGYADALGALAVTKFGKFESKDVAPGVDVDTWSRLQIDFPEDEPADWLSGAPLRGLLGRVRHLARRNQPPEGDGLHRLADYSRDGTGRLPVFRISTEIVPPPGRGPE